MEIKIVKSQRTFSEIQGDCWLDGEYPMASEDTHEKAVETKNRLAEENAEKIMAMASSGQEVIVRRQKNNFKILIMDGGKLWRRISWTMRVG